MKIPASPLLFASLALTSSTLAAPVARGRESSPSPNPDCDGFDAPARMPAPRAVSGSTAPAAARLAQREEGPKSVMIGRNARQGRKVRRVVSMGNQQKRDDAPAPVPEGDGTVNANGLLDGLLGGAGGGLLKPVGDLLGGVVDTVGGLVDGVGGSLPGGLGDTVRGVVDPLTGHLSDGLKTGTVPGIANGAVDGVKGALDGLTGSGGGVLKGVLGRRDAGLLGQVGQVTNGLPVVGGLTQQVTDGLANGHPVSGLVGTANGLVGTVGNVLPGGLGDTVTGLTGGILGGVGATADGLLSPVVGQNGIVNGLVGDNGALGGLLSPVLGEQGVVDGLLGGNGLVGGVLGDQGVVGGVLGKNGLVGGLLGGGNGGSGLVGGLLGGGGNGGGLPIVGGLLGGGNGPGGGLPIVGGLLGGGGNGGLLGGLLGGSAPKPADNSAKAASALPDPLALIKQQGGVVRDLGNGNFLTTAGGVVQVPLNLAAQLGGLLSQTTQTAQGAVGKVSGLATSSLPGPVAGVAGSAVGAAQGVLGTAAHAASGAVDTASQAVKGATGTVGSATGQAANLASASTPSGIPSGVPASLNGATSTLLGMTGSAVPPVQNLAGSPLSALGDLSKLDLSSLSPADLQQLAQFASGSLPATSALMQNLAVDPSTLSIPTGAQEGQHLPGTAMGGRLAIPTPSGMPLPSGAPGIPDTTFHVLGATPVGAMMGAASHAVPSNIPSSLPSLASVPSVNPYNNPDAASTGKVPSSDAAKALASQIAQNGQKLSDEEYAAKIQALKDQLARMAAAASGTAGDAAGQSASAQLQSLLALSNGLTNADLGKVDGVMLSPHGAAVVPTPAASVPSSIPTTLPSASPSGLANAAAIPSTFSDDLSADAYDAADEYEDCSDCDDDDDDEWEEEAYSDDGNVQLLNADVYPNFFSGDNAVLGAQGSAIGLASAANVAAAAVTGAPVPSASGLPGQAQVGSAIRSVSSAYLPSATAVVPVPSASASMIPQNSSGLA